MRPNKGGGDLVLTPLKGGESDFKGLIPESRHQVSDGDTLKPTVPL